MTVDDGGPAFPHDADYVRGDVGGEYIFNVDFHPGMSLRDWFAGMSLVGLMARPSMAQAREEYVAEVARKAYAFADAMLQVRACRDTA